MPNIFPWQNRNQIPQSATFTLTELGRSRAEEYTGDNRSRILMALDANGASNAEEIARASRVSKGAVERAIPSLIQGGYIQSTRTTG